MGVRSVRRLGGVTVFVTAGVAATVLAGGCSSSGSTASTAAPTQSGSSAGPAPSGYLRVTIKDFAFDPATLQAKVGQTVVITNADSAPHNWTADGGAFKSPDLNQGQSYSYTFQKAGTYSVRCTIHPSMAPETVVVTS